MQRQHIILRCSILAVLLGIARSSLVEVFLDDRAGNVQALPTETTTSYEMPLFQKRYLTINIDPSQLKQDTRLIGYKFQIESSHPHVLEIEKQRAESMDPMQKQDRSGEILAEDLYILSKKDALGHIFNAYPSPHLNPINDEQGRRITWSIRGETMEQTKLTLRLDFFYGDESSSTYRWSWNVLVTQPKRVVDRIFYIMMPFIVIFVSIQMGILLETKVLIDLVKRPKAVLIGFFAQYGLMPFLALAITKIFRYSPLHGLALFVIGCCPGSGASNQWTLLFDGDVNLSAVMSFVSTASSFVMMPLYFYTLGRIYMDELKIKVPYFVLFRTLALVVIPYATGIVISHYSPKTRRIVKRMVKPLMLFLLIFFLVFGTIVNWYMFTMIDLFTALTAPLLPYLGFVFGGLIAWMFGLDWKYVKTIGIEAGIQNTGIAFMIMFYSFPQPYATQSIVVPLVVAFLTTKPFWLIYVIRNRMKKSQKKKELKNSSHGSTLANGNGETKTVDAGEETSVNKKPNEEEKEEKKEAEEEILQMIQTV